MVKILRYYPPIITFSFLYSDDYDVMIDKYFNKNKGLHFTMLINKYLIVPAQVDINDR